MAPNLKAGGGGGANIWFCQFPPKIEWNRKSLDLEKVAGPEFYYLYPPRILCFQISCNFGKVVISDGFYWTLQTYLI